MVSMFESTNFDGDIGSWVVSNVTNMASMFEGSGMSQSINGWDVSNVTDMNHMFEFNITTNSDFSSWDVSNVTDMSYMFQSTSVNWNIGAWDTGNVTDMTSMLQNTQISFNRDISGWDVSSLLSADDILENSLFSNANYVLLLAGWSVQTLQSGVTFTTDAQYTEVSEPDRDSMIGDGWTMEDNGCSDCTNPLTIDNILYFKMDEPSGTTAIDAVGTQDGTLVGGTLINQTGFINEGYTFDGTNDYVNVPYALDGSAGWSASCWVKYGGANAGIVIGQRYNASTASFGIYNNNNGTFAIQIYNASGSFFGSFNVSVPAAGNWFHIAVTYTISDKARAYVNGSIDTSINVNTSGVMQPVFSMGRNAFSNAQFLDMTLDEVSLWERPITSGEVTELYNSGSGLQYPY